MNLRTRELRLDASRADASQRRVPAVISTEFAVERDGFSEVLLHGSENVDLSRAPLPLIESHDGHRLNIGLVENLRLAGGKLRGDIVFGSSNRALELWPDVASGIVRNLSIGYVIVDHEMRGETLVATRWQPFETSLVSIPADPNAGTYRSNHMERNNELPEVDSGERLSRSQRRALNNDDRTLERAMVAERELERVNEIHAIARAYAHRVRRGNAHDIASRAVDQGLTVKQFQEALMAAMATVGPMPTAGSTPDGTNANGDQASGDPAASGRGFSIVRAIAGVIDPRGVDNGYERECSQELSRRIGRQPTGIYMPMGRLGKRVFSVSGAAAMVGEEHLGSEFIDALRARSFVMGLGVRLLTGLTQDVSIPRLATSATSGWIAGDGADGFTPSAPGIDSVTLTPKTVGALTILSRKMVLQGDPDAEQLVRDDFAKLIAGELDRAAINGSGSSNQPTGVINTSGVTTGTYSHLGPAYGDVLSMESSLMLDNADSGKLAYLTEPLLASYMKATPKVTDGSNFVWTAGKERGVGDVNGFPAYATTNVPTDKIILGNWEDLIMGIWGAVDIAVDPNYDFAKGSIGVRVMASVDFAVRNPKSFVVFHRHS